MKARSFLFWHLLLSLFFMPMIVIYAVTGMMYMAGVDNQFTSDVRVYELNPAEKAPFTDSIRKLADDGVAIPPGEVRFFKGNHMLGTPIDYHINFVKKGDKLTAEVVKPGIYPKLMMAHKGKAGLLFTILGYGAGVSLLAVYITGIVGMWNNKKTRSWMIGSSLVGLLCVLIAWFLM